MMWSFLGVVLSLLFVAIDTQMIMNDRKYGIGYDDYIVAALIIYMDFIRMFLEILRLFGEKK